MSDFCSAELDIAQKSLLWKEKSRPYNILLRKTFQK